MAKILIIDDEKDICELLEELFKEEGWNAITANDGKEALDHLSSECIDLVITDMVMPKMEGTEILKTIMKDYPAIKIIVMSGGARIGSKDFNEAAQNLGIKDALRKPIDFNILLKTVKRLLVE